jgi:hypothetical protein
MRVLFANFPWRSTFLLAAGIWLLPRADDLARALIVCAVLGYGVSWLKES